MSRTHRVSRARVGRPQLGVYDRMKNELLDSEASEAGVGNALLQTLHGSAQLCLRVPDEESSGARRTAESLLGVLNLKVWRGEGQWLPLTRALDS